MLAGLAERGRRLAPESRGALAFVAGLLLFALMDAIAKHLSGQLPPLQVVWARYVSQTALIAVLFLPRLPTLLATRHPRIQLLRGLCLFAATSLFFTSLAYLQLAEAVALLQTSPILIVALAAAVLGERVGPRRWIAVAAGMAGALVMLRPGIGVFQPAALLAMAAALGIAAYQVATRRLGGGDSIWTTLAYTTAVGAVLASLAMPFVWQAPTGAQVFWLCLIGVPGFLGHFALVWALGRAEASALAPLNYTDLVWAGLLGFVAFGEVPHATTLAGAAIVVGAGLFLWYRERAALPDAAAGA